MPLERGDGRLAEVDGLLAHRERLAAEPGEVEEIADEALQASRLALDHGGGARPLEHAVLERLGMPADRGQRRLQLVADRQEERPLRVLAPLELLPRGG